MKDLHDRVEALDKRVGAEEALRNDRRLKAKALKAEVEALLVEADLLGKVDQALLAVSSKVLGQSTDNIDKLITTGLKLVFDNISLEFKAHVSKSRGKTSINFELLENGKAAPIMDSYGGGVLVVAGVLLRVVVIMALGLRRVLLLDESLSHLSEQYIPNASKLLKKMCEELDFTIIMVTHQDGFTEYADKHYRAVRKAEGTIFEEVVSKTTKIDLVTE